MSLYSTSHQSKFLRVDIHDIVRLRSFSMTGVRFLRSVESGCGDIFLVTALERHEGITWVKRHSMVTGAIEQAIAEAQKRKAWNPKIFALVAPGGSAKDGAEPIFDRVTEVLGERASAPCLLLMERGAPVVVNSEESSIPTSNLRRLFPFSQ